MQRSRHHSVSFATPRAIALLALLTVSASLTAQEPELVPLESVDAMTRSMWLIDGTVMDAKTGQPVANFVVTPGSLSKDDAGKSTIRWRDNLKRPMKAGRLRWPRTSGFSVMRFRVTADGYKPLVTQRIWRGGPHTRILVRLQPVENQPPGK